MTFQSLSIRPILCRALEGMGYGVPTPVQALAIPVILAGRDLVALAPTGSGKTAAFVTGVTNVLLDTRPRKPTATWNSLRALVLCPTRELAQQVEREAAHIIAGSALRSTCAYGKSAMSPQAEAIREGIDILVATPGRVKELTEAGHLDLSAIRVIVIDEADRMLDLGFLPQVERIMTSLPEPRQVLMFTATMPREVAELAKRFAPEAERVEAPGANATVEHVDQRAFAVEDEEKTATLIELCAPPNGKPRTGVLVFCRTRRRVGWVATALGRHKISVGQLHGDKTQAQRQRAFDAFKTGKFAVLVATDVAARGLHIEAVRTVVNYDLPFDPEDYVHRVGRAEHGANVDGRPRRGQAFSFVSRSDREAWSELEQRTGRPIDLERPQAAEEMAVAKVMKRVRQEDQAAKASAPVVKRSKQRRSFRSKPIKKGQKPGSGVKK
jgi:ATP-dependent RNA helicase RhlE